MTGVNWQGCGREGPRSNQREDRYICILLAKLHKSRSGSHNGHPTAPYYEARRFATRMRYCVSDEIYRVPPSNRK
jgi:hypothetical protein